MDREILGFSATEWTALTAIINTAAVIVLVLVNIFYLRSVKTQANAGVSQASAASDNIQLLKSQIQDQTSLKLTEILIDFRRLLMRLEWWTPKVRDGWGALPSELAFFPTTAQLPSVRVPTMALRGAQDPDGTEPAMRQLAKLVPGARYEEIPNANHFCNVDQPDVILVGQAKRLALMSGEECSAWGRSILDPLQATPESA